MPTEPVSLGHGTRVYLVEWADTSTQRLQDHFKMIMHKVCQDAFSKPMGQIILDFRAIVDRAGIPVYFDKHPLPLHVKEEIRVLNAHPDRNRHWHYDHLRDEAAIGTFLPRPWEAVPTLQQDDLVTLYAYTRYLCLGADQALASQP